MTRSDIIRRALDTSWRPTGFFALVARDSLGHTAVMLERLQREGHAESKTGYAEMLWRAT